MILVCVEALPGAKIDGCAFFLDGVPVIGLSGRRKRLDKILFTLLHEVAHLALGHVHPDVIIVEEVEQRSREDVCEEEANAPAGAWILPRPLSFPRDRINQAWIARIAQERSLAPIVVIGHLQNMGRLEWRTTLARNAPNVTEELENWLRPCRCQPRAAHRHSRLTPTFKPEHLLTKPVVASSFAWTRQLVEGRAWQFEIWSGAPAAGLR